MLSELILTVSETTHRCCVEEIQTAAQMNVTLTGKKKIREHTGWHLVQMPDSAIMLHPKPMEMLKAFLSPGKQTQKCVSCFLQTGSP